MSDDNWKTVKKDLISKAEGRVLEVGAGSGLTTAYYDESKVSQSSYELFTFRSRWSEREEGLE